MDEHVWLTYLLYKLRNNRNNAITIDELRRDPGLVAANNQAAGLWRGMLGRQNDGADARPYQEYHSRCGMGFAEMANPRTFTTAYKNATGISGIYTPNEVARFFQKTRLYSELYFPSTILAKTMYYSTMGDDATGEDVRLFSAVNDGLMYLL